MYGEAKGTPSDRLDAVDWDHSRRGRLAHCRACGRDFWKLRPLVGVASAYCSVRCRQQASNARKREKRRAAALAAAQAAAGGPPRADGGPPAA